MRQPGDPSDKDYKPYSGASYSSEKVTKFGLNEGLEIQKTTVLEYSEEDAANPYSVKITAGQNIEGYKSATYSFSIVLNNPLPLNSIVSVICTSASCIKGDESIIPQNYTSDLYFTCSSPQCNKVNATDSDAASTVVVSRNPPMINITNIIAENMYRGDTIQFSFARLNTLSYGNYIFDIETSQ